MIQLVDPPTGIVAGLAQFIGLFFKPYIGVKPKLEKITKQITLNIDNKPVSKFNINFWALHFENKAYKLISRYAKSFYIGLNLIKNNVTLNNPEYILVWKDTNFVIPSEINFNTTNEESKRGNYPTANEYLEILVNSLPYHLKPEGIHTVNLPTSTGRDIIFFISIEGVNNTYLLHYVQYANSKDKLIVTSNSIYEPEDFELELTPLSYNTLILHLLFHINKRDDSKGKKFELNIKNWDNLELKKK